MVFAIAALENQLYANGKTLQVTFEYSQTGVGSSEMQYIRTPSRVMCLADEAQAYLRKSSYDPAKDERRTYELLKASGEQNGYVVTGSSGANPLTSTAVMDPILYSVGYDGSLLDKIRQGVIADSMEEIGGHECYRIDITPEKKGLKPYTIWLDPKIGYCPRRVVEHESKPTVVEFTDYIDLGGGIWFPRKITQTVDMPLLRKEVPSLTSDTVELISRAIDVRLVEADSAPAANVEFPSGTKVTDEITGMTYTVK